MIAYRPGEIELPTAEQARPVYRDRKPLRGVRPRHRPGRAVRARIERSLEGQRRLVREVHHRVKNNLQVVASLLNIHGRTAEAPDARAAYAGISRRVGALSIVHRNHFAEMEENRGIALRPLLTELAAELRVSAPEDARGLMIDLDLDTVHTTQDVAVAVAFLVTEIVEFAMFNAPKEPIEISIRRTSELTARLSISSQVLNPDEGDESGKGQFERIIAGLAKQLRSPLDRKLGRYSVELPVFPLGSIAVAAFRYGSGEKNSEASEPVPLQGTLCSSDSDLLPPRSRYPIKWARNRQPSPPPVALPGPLLSGPPTHRREFLRQRTLIAPRASE